MRLRNVLPGDAEVYRRIRCDPVMTAHLGGPLPHEGIAAKAALDAERTAADEWWVRMIVLDDADGEAGGQVAGSVSLWPSEADGEALSEIGWAVLPEFQGRGLATRAVRTVLRAAAADGRWGLVHAFPAVSNAASEGVCRATGFTRRGIRDLPWADRTLRVRQWTTDPARAAPPAPR